MPYIWNGLTHIFHKNCKFFESYCSNINTNIYRYHNKNLQKLNNFLKIKNKIKIYITENMFFLNK